MINVTPVILCDGSSILFWPLSRIGFPKQFLCLTGNESLFQQAEKRVATLSQDGICVAAKTIGFWRICNRVMSALASPLEVDPENGTAV